MRISSAALLVMSCVVVTTGAAAQDQNQPPPKVNDITPGFGSAQLFEAERLRRMQTPGGEDIDREALATRVATLIDEGKCEEARQAAREGRDREMARTVSRICVPRDTAQ